MNYNKEFVMVGIGDDGLPTMYLNGKLSDILNLISVVIVNLAHNDKETFKTIMLNLSTMASCNLDSMSDIISGSIEPIE